MSELSRKSWITLVESCDRTETVYHHASSFYMVIDCLFIFHLLKIPLRKKDTSMATHESEQSKNKKGNDVFCVFFRWVQVFHAKFGPRKVHCVNILTKDSHKKGTESNLFPLSLFFNTVYCVTQPYPCALCKRKIFTRRKKQRTTK